MHSWDRKRVSEDVFVVHDALAWAGQYRRIARVRPHRVGSVTRYREAAIVAVETGLSTIRRCEVRRNLHLRKWRERTARGLVSAGEPIRGWRRLHTRLPRCEAARGRGVLVWHAISLIEADGRS